MRKTATPNSIAITCLLAAVVVAATSQVSHAEKIGKVSEPLVAGNEVSPAEQQSQTLVAVDTWAVFLQRRSAQQRVGN